MAQKEPNQDATMANVKKAIAWIQEHRKKPGGDAYSMSEIVTLAGLHRSHADQFNRDRTKTVTTKTVRKLAQRWDVRVAWMLNGQPPIEPYAETDDTDPYPDRQASLVWARKVGFPESAIAAVAKMTFREGTEDPGGPYWVRQIENEAKIVELSSPSDASPELKGVAPKEWPAVAPLVDRILIAEAKDSSPYFPAIWGFLVTKTDEPAPRKLSLDELWAKIHAFDRAHKGDPKRAAWRTAAIAYHEAHKPKQPPTSAPRVARARRE